MGYLQLPVMASTSLMDAGYVAQVVLLVYVVPSGQVHARGVLSHVGSFLSATSARGKARAETKKVEMAMSFISNV